MRRVRVAHVITRLCRGGAQENTFQSVRLANRERFDVDLVAGFPSGAEGSMEDRVRAAGIDIVRIPALVRQIAPRHDLRALQTLTRLFRERRYDIVHTHTSKAGFVGRLAARRAGVPIIVHTPHGNIFDGYFSGPVTRIFVQMERYAARFTDRIIMLTPKGIDEELAQGIGHRDQYVTIESGIDLAPFAAAIAQREATRAALGIAPDAILIGGVGRLEPVKGFRYFADAAKTVASEHPAARFVLIGQGSEEPALKAQVDSLGDRFQFLGYQEDVARWMAALDILVLPSLNEGMGRVLVEAAAAGIAVIASNVGGVPDIVRPGETGLLVPPRNASAIADAIRTLITDPARRTQFGQTARTVVAPKFEVREMIRRIETLYDGLLTRSQDALNCPKGEAH